MRNSPILQRGFTMIELAIVLAVIAVIIAALISARTIISASELQSVVANVNEFKIAISAFERKYNAFPGDLRNAKSYWPDPDCVSDGFSSCNGNNNGFIDINGEHFRAWNHLSLGGFLPALYTGTQDGTKATIDVNMPPSSVPNGGFQLLSNNIYGLSLRNYIQFSSEENNDMDGPILSPQQARTIDEKIDDAFAATGKVLTTKGFSGSSFLDDGCVTSADFTAPSTYILSDETLSCRMFFAFN